MSNINLIQYHPIAAIEDHFIFSSNGNVVACYKGLFPEIYSQSESDFEDLHSTWFQGLKSLPTGYIIHKQDIYLKKKFTSENLSCNSFLSKATHSYFKGREYMDHTCYLFFVLTKNKHLNNPKYVNPFRQATEKLPEVMEHELKEFKIAIADTVFYMNNGRKVTLTPLSKDEILLYTQTYFNGFNIDYDSSIELGKKKISVGKNHFDVLGITSELCFGGQVQTSKINERFTSDDFVFHQGYLDGLGISLNENHILNQIIVLDGKNKWRKILDRKIEELRKSSNFGSQNKVVLKKMEHLLDQINTDDNSRVIRGHLNIIYWDKDVSRLEVIGSKIKTEFKELDIIPYYPGTEERKNMFLNSFGCFSSNFSNDNLYVTELKHALCLLINNTNYKSDETGITFNDREYNIPVLKDVWDEQKKRIKARNFAIFAPTGEGKSFLANSILRQYFEMGLRLVIIDLGGSYTKFAQLYPEQYTILRYERGKNLGINPFFISNLDDVSPERLEDLAVFIFELLASDIKVTKAQSVSLRKILHLYYKEVYNQHSLNTFYNFVDLNKSRIFDRLGIQPEYFNVNNFLHILSEYVGDGLYSFLFKVNEDQSYKLEDRRMIIFELDEVKDNREILSVMLKLIKTAIQRTIWRNKKEKGIILFDEFAKQLKFPNVLESVEYYYQAIRKQEGAIGIILQSINQLPANSTSASILENTQVIYSLRNEKGYDDLVDRLSLSPHDHHQLKSIRNNFISTRKYTEFLLKIGKESNVFRLEVPPEAYAAYLTDGPDHDLIMKLYQEVGCMETAIRKFIKSKSKTS